VGPAGAGGPRNSEASWHERGRAEPGARRGKREEEDDGLTGGPKLSVRGKGRGPASEREWRWRASPGAQRLRRGRGLRERGADKWGPAVSRTGANAG
jgi:hypothetical protein